ncbi:transcriptional regulator [Pseudohoeflea suaedae]|uniref:Transcriptional regulator n=1 Tax=Pseudohoeflea suaedae TaxID=877384 RepID=A0A4R5PK40_9HYPH|nr:ChrR family anti-sigma-E factor [Pseudohoeflea suaedae]TDH36071.1 transcriptional regulator [Pseudohoeflea suaedae]
MVAEQLETLMARYVAGSLPAPVRVLIATHLAMKPESRAMCEALESLSGAELSDLQGVALEDRDGMLARILASEPPAAVEKRRKDRDTVFPAPLVDFLGFDLADVPWKTRLPGYKIHDMGIIDGIGVNLFNFRPDRAAPSHTHHGLELSLVLSGGFTDVFGHYLPGDISVADPDVDHRPQADPGEPCIGFQVIEGPLKLTGPLVRRLRDLIG